MEEQNKPIRLMALIGLILQIICTGITVLSRLFPKPFLAVMQQQDFAEDAARATRHPLLLLTPFVGLVIYVLLYCLLQGQLRNPGDSAGTVFGLTIAAIPAMGIINLLLSFFTQRFVHLYYDAAALGALSLVNSSLNVITIMGSVAFPLLTAAAAMHWQRIRDLSMPR